jgi:hypothetical protein
MEVDHSHDHIAFNGINVDEDSSDSDNEEDGDSEMIIDHDIMPNEIIINEPRPSRIRKQTSRYRLSPPVIVIPNKARKTNKRNEIPIVQIDMHVQRRASVLMAIQNHIRKINITHQINVNANEEIIDVAAVIRPRAAIDNELPQANPQRRINALNAIQALIYNERRDIEANVRNAGLNEIQARDKLKSDLLLAGTGVVPDTLLIDPSFQV